VTVSVIRELMSRLLSLQRLTFARILEELNAWLQRKEESRIYWWLEETGEYPPRRGEEPATTARRIEIEPATDPPEGVPLAT
jgi:hypothetical protein